MATEVTLVDLGVIDGLRVTEVRDAETNEVIGYNKTDETPREQHNNSLNKLVYLKLTSRRRVL